MLPCVGVVYTKESAVSREEAQLAQYVALCLAASGRCAKTSLVGVKTDGRSDVKSTRKSGAVGLRCDGVLLDSRELLTEIYEETDDWKTLETCDLWLLVVETDATLAVAEFLHKKLDKQKEQEEKKKQQKCVVLSLQTTMRRLAQLNSAYVKSYDVMKMLTGVNSEGRCVVSADCQMPLCCMEEQRSKW